MARVFRRGELRGLVLIVLDNLGETHAYAVLSELDSRIEAWTPSPGAVYPALLALVDAGWVSVRQVDDTKLYVTTVEGQKRAAVLRRETRWPGLSRRARDSESGVTVGLLVDQFSAGLPSRRKLVSGLQRDLVQELLNDTRTKIEKLVHPKQTEEKS